MHACLITCSDTKVGSCACTAPRESFQLAIGAPTTSKLCWCRRRWRAGRWDRPGRPTSPACSSAAWRPGAQALSLTTTLHQALAWPRSGAAPRPPGAVACSGGTCRACGGICSARRPGLLGARWARAPVLAPQRALRQRRRASTPRQPPGIACRLAKRPVSCHLWHLAMALRR